MFFTCCITSNSLALPEIPYDLDVVCDALRERAEHGKTFSIPAPGKMEGVTEGGACCLAVRPESIILSATEGPLPGVISRATYYGAKVEYEVMLGEQPSIVEVYNPQLSERFAEGDQVHMTLIDRCVRVLP